MGENIHFHQKNPPKTQHTSLTASSALLEATAKISVVELNAREVAAVTKFIIALTGLGLVSWRQVSLVYTFTTPELELREKRQSLFKEDTDK